jgi:hypothetical protein
MDRRAGHYARTEGFMTPSSDELVLATLRQAFRAAIPTGSVIAARAIASAIAGHEEDPAWIKGNFSRLVEDIQIAAYEEYLVAERTAGEAAIIQAFTPLVDANATATETLEAVANRFGALDRFYLGLTQGRRPRAGKAFELLIREFFIRLRYPFTAQASIDGQPDFVIPSVDHYRNNPMDCVVFTIKRTLRERWRQIVTEGARGLGFFLATIDEGIAARDLQEILDSRIILVVPIRVKQSRADYADAMNVITFEFFFEHHMDPAMRRWIASGVIGGE